MLIGMQGTRFLLYSLFLLFASVQSSQMNLRSGEGDLNDLLEAVSLAVDAASSAV
jgi:hypothetical protein